METERTCSMRSLRMVRPLGRTVLRIFRFWSIYILVVTARSGWFTRGVTVLCSSKRTPVGTETSGMTPGGNQYVQLLDATGGQSERLLFGLSNEQLTALAEDLKLPAYRARQLSEALYAQWHTRLDDISTLPKELRESLTAAGFRVGLPTIVETFRSVDGTERYLIACGDSATVETVWICL